MLSYVVRRFLQTIPLLFAVSIVSFILINLPPGDFLTSYILELEALGEEVTRDRVAALEMRYGLDRPIYVQYFRWVSGFLTGDFGYSFEYRRPVHELIWSRVGLTVVVTGCSLLFTWVAALILGLYSATHQYSFGDYVATVFGFLGLAIPNFLLALILMWVAHRYLGQSVGGLFSPAYRDAAWSIGRVLDMLKHLWIPVIVIGTAGTAGTMRILRANLLDELHKPAVVAARAKGVPKTKLLFKYPLRIAILPFISTVGWTLPTLFSGEAIAAIVLSLPTVGPLLLRALQMQDMYLAGALIVFLSVLTIIGTMISDILLAWVDPRIRYH